MGLKDIKERFNDARDLQKSSQTIVTPKDEKTLDKRGLDIENYSPEQLKHLNAATIRKINEDLRANGLLKLALSFGGNSVERATLGYLSALVEQNWILIRQNQLLLTSLEKIEK